MNREKKAQLNALGFSAADQLPQLATIPLMTVMSANATAMSVAGFGICWALIKATAGISILLRQDRVLEYVEWIRDNPNVFREELFNSTEFQDACVYCFNKYIIERSEEKREYIKNILLGFVKAGCREEYPLERYNSVIEQLSNIDVATLKDFDFNQADPNYRVYGGEKRNIDNLYSLINFGILRNNTGSRIGVAGDDPPWVQSTQFGREFVQYVICPEA